jgi:rhamnose utilization protein RhaD (predicted bifunctional aldolase and dehydrogenase)
MKAPHSLSLLSSIIGSNLDLIQGAGGNTSVKDGDILWVKASGYRLIDAIDREIFVPINYQGVIARLKNGEDDPVTSEVIQTDGTEFLKPSIETTLHALMPHKYVIHVHSVNTIANAVLCDGEQKIGELLNGIKWSWVPYVRPGVPLTNEVQKVVKQRLDVLILANHGLVIGAETIGGIYRLLDTLEKKLFCIKRKVLNIDEQKIRALAKNTNYKCPKYDFVHSLAFDKISMEIASKSPLYPDHVVFIGPGPMWVGSESEARSLLKQENRNDQKVLIIEHIGVLVYKEANKGVDDMLHCLTNVLLRIDAKSKLNHLTEEDELELINWDAEKYRQDIKKINRNKVCKL